MIWQRDYSRRSNSCNTTEQRTADEQPVANESRARLSISVGRRASRMWERVREMRENDRLLRVKNHLMAL